MFSLDKEDVNFETHPHSNSKEDFGDKAIDLLLYEKPFIFNECLDRCIQSGNGHTMFDFNRRLHDFETKENRDSHMQCRELFKPCKTTIPSEDDTKIKFSGTKCFTIPVAIYADLEVINEPMNDCGLQNTEHKVVSARFYADYNKIR